MADEWAHLTGVGPGKRLQNSSQLLLRTSFCPGREPTVLVELGFSGFDLQPDP